MKIAIVGAGIGGLSAAYDLARAGQQVTLYEVENYIGGLATGFKEPGWDWSVERYYHHWFQTDHHILSLIDELGWRDKVRFLRPYTVMYYDGKFYPFDSIPYALIFPGLGWGINKIRFGLVAVYLRLLNHWQQLEKVTTATWMHKWAGEKVYKLMWEPLLVGKFGSYYQDVNMAWMWARVKSRTTRLGTFEGGFQAFADAFAERLRSLGVVIHLSTPVTIISPNPQRGLTIKTKESAQDFDQCLVTLSPAALSHLAPELPQETTRGLRSLKSLGAVVLILALKHRLSEEGYYWFNLPKSEGYPFLALVEHTNFLSPEYFGGEHIVYCGDYLETGHEYFQLSQEELLERFLPALSRFNPNFKPDWVRKTWLFRTAYAQPVPLVNHSRNIPEIKTPIPGLFFASMSQVYPWDRGMNYAVEIGRRAARLMMELMSGP